MPNKPPEDNSSQPSNSPITVQEIQKQIKDAVKTFGSYSYVDKGPGEVMNMSSIVSPLKTMSPREVGAILVELLKTAHGRIFVEYVVGDFDRMPAQWVEELLAFDKRIKDCY